jgi:hypothetical protein
MVERQEHGVPAVSPLTNPGRISPEGLSFSVGRLLTLEHAGDASRDGGGQNPTCRDEEVRQPLLGASWVKRILLAEVNKGHEQIERVDDGVEVRGSLRLQCWWRCDAKTTLPISSKKASQSAVRQGWYP